MLRSLYTASVFFLLSLSLSGMHVYTVEAQDGSHTNMIGARGNCQLAITCESEVLCALVPSKQVVGVWRFNCLRRYWCGDGVFGFEAGKRSPRGEGTFTFQTSQDEEIYTILKRYIEKAKQATLQGKRYEGEAKDVMMDVNDRPKFPLPREVSAAVEVPIRRSPGSDGGRPGKEVEVGPLTYESIPVDKENLVGPPRSMSPYERRNSLHHTDISGPSPVYSLKRAQTTKPRRVQQWVETTEASLLGGKSELGGTGVVSDNAPLRSPPPAERGTLTVAEEDMYSHTQHVMPAPFQRHATVHNVVEESTYHALVHGRSDTIKRKRESQSEEGGAEGASIYSIAYPPNVAVSGARQVHVSAGPGDEYGTLDRNAADCGPPRGRTLSNLPLAPAKTADEREEIERALPNCQPPPEHTNVRKKSDFEDSMTVNLLYDSQASVLGPLGSDPVGREGAGSVSLQEELEKPESLRMGGASGAMVNESSERSKEDTDNGGGGAEEGRGGGEKEGGVIERDAKGYSKVDKSKKQKHPEDLEDPPPIPPRLYDGAEDEVGLQSHGDPTRESPMSPAGDDVAVSDV